MNYARSLRRTRTGAGRITQTFRSGGLRKYILHTSLWGSGHQMTTVAQIYVLVQLTDSEFQLAILGGASAIGTTATALIGGALADRFSRKSMLLFGSATTALLTLLLGTLLVTNLAQPWHIQVGGFIQGSMLAMDWTARFAIMPNMVERRRLVRAIPFDNATFNLTRIVAPLIWGGILAVLDHKAPYFVVAALLVANMIVVSRFKPVSDISDHVHGRLRSEIAEMPRIFASNPRISGTLAFTMITALAGGGLVYMITPYGQNVLDISPQGISMLFSAFGIGGLAGALIVGLVGAPKRIGWALIATALAFATFALGFALVGFFVAAVVFACLVSISHATNVSMGYITLMLSTTDETRGRIAGMYELAWSGFPLGGLIFPAIAGFSSDQLALLVVPAMLATVAIIIAITNPTLRGFRLERR